MATDDKDTVPTFGGATPGEPFFGKNATRIEVAARAIARLARPDLDENEVWRSYAPHARAALVAVGFMEPEGTARLAKPEERSDDAPSSSSSSSPKETP